MKEKCTDESYTDSYPGIPCVDCVSLPICISIFKEVTSGNKNSMLFLRPLAAKCILLLHYLRDRESDDLTWSTVNILNVYDYFDKVLNDIKKE
jgi:hypothetical protein